MTVAGTYGYILFCNNSSPLSKLRLGQCVCVCGGGGGGGLLMILIFL